VNNLTIRSLADPPTTIEPWQRLACAVLHQALLDASNDSATGARDRARGWLQEQRDGFRFWCDVAGVNADVITAGVRRRLEGHEAEG
jgi:hypothetical protein